MPGNPATAQELPQVTVIGNAPLPGLGLPLNQIPAECADRATARTCSVSRPSDLADYLNNNFSGVSVSESADNPFQLDINYHGFTASPLLGTPEGLSVYVDGVRVNESFGDTVNWDLIPESAISTVTLMSGSNPVFGLNTLGGALSVQTKSGHDNPGTEIEAYGGSFGRRSFAGADGRRARQLRLFLRPATTSTRRGWRDMSPTRVYQGFGKVGWQNEKTDIDLSYTYADTSLYGNGAVPQSMLDLPSRDQLHAGLHPESAQFRQSHRHAVPDRPSAAVRQCLLSPPGHRQHQRQRQRQLSCGRLRRAADRLQRAAGRAASTSPIARSRCRTRSSRLLQRTAGFGVQLTDSQDLFGWSNQAIVGADYDDSQRPFRPSRFSSGRWRPIGR